MQVETSRSCPQSSKPVLASTISDPLHNGMHRLKPSISRVCVATTIRVAK